MFPKSNPYLDVFLPALLLLLLLQLLVEDPLLDLLQLVPGEVTEDLLQLTDRDRGSFSANGWRPSTRFCIVKVLSCVTGPLGRQGRLLLLGSIVLK